MSHSWLRAVGELQIIMAVEVVAGLRNQEVTRLVIMVVLTEVVGEDHLMVVVAAAFMEMALAMVVIHL